MITIGVFYRGLFNFFFQDDFFNISLGWIHTPRDFFNIFTSFLRYPNNAFRPIPYYLFGSVIIHFFQLNSVLTHITLFLIHGLNIYLIWRLIGKFTKKKTLQFSPSYLYAIHTVHFGVLYWLSADYLLFGTTFLLFLFFIILSYEHRPTPLKFFGFLFVFVLTLLTNEALFVLPVFLLFVQRIFHLKHIKKIIIPTILLSILSFLFRLRISGFSALPDYQIGTIPEVIKTFLWYIQRSLNISEGVRLMGRTEFLASSALFIVAFLLTGYAMVFHAKSREKPDTKILIISVIFFLIFGAPFFLLAHHLSSYYMNTAVLGVIGMITFLWIPKMSGKTTISPMLFFICFGLLSFVNIQFLNRTSWLVWRGEVARKYITLVKNRYPQLPKGSTVVFLPRSVSDSELSVALYNDIALKLLLNDPTFHTIIDRAHISLPGEYRVSDLIQ